MQQNNPLNNSLIQLIIVAIVFIVVMVTVGQTWTPEQIRDLFFLILFGFGIKEGIPRQIGRVFEPGEQTTPPTAAPISQEEQDMRLKIQQYEREIAALLLVQDERDALVYTLNKLGLRVTVRVNQ